MGEELAIRIKATRYQCPHCRATRAKSQAAERHIARCFKNPRAKSCKTCALFQPAENGDYDTGYPGCDESCDLGLSLASGLRVHCKEWVQP